MPEFFNSMITAIRALDPLSLLVGAGLGSVAGTWHAHFMKRPNIIISGGGGGGGPGPGYHVSCIRFKNAPRFLGVRLRQTTIFGWDLINGNWEWGLLIDTVPVRKCRALLYDKESRECIAQLYWEDSTQSGALTDSMTLDSGDEASVKTFARLHDDKQRYFVFEPATVGGHEPRVPDSNRGVWLNDSREFLIKIMYADGRANAWFPIKVTKEFKGGFRFSYGTSSGGL